MRDFVPTAIHCLHSGILYCVRFTKVNPICRHASVKPSSPYPALQTKTCRGTLLTVACALNPLVYLVHMVPSNLGPVCSCPRSPCHRRSEGEPSMCASVTGCRSCHTRLQSSLPRWTTPTSYRQLRHIDDVGILARMFHTSVFVDMEAQ